MNITPALLSELHDSYRKKVKAVVLNYHSKYHYSSEDFPELMQVAWKAFYDLVVRLNEEDGNLNRLRIKYYKAVESRLKYHFEQMYPVHIPHEDFYKKYSDYQFESMDAVPEPAVAARNDDPADVADCNAFLDTLTEEQRKIVELRLLERTHEEIMEIMGTIDKPEHHYWQVKLIKRRMAEYYQLSKYQNLIPKKKGKAKSHG